MTVLNNKSRPQRESKGIKKSRVRSCNIIYEGFGVIGSERRASFAARVPECDNLEEIALHSIVEKVSNSGEV